MMRLADDHRRERSRETHAKHQDRACHGARDDHGKAEPDQRDGERAAARGHRHGFVLVFVSEKMIDLIFGDVEVIDHGALFRNTAGHSTTSFNEWVCGAASRCLVRHRNAADDCCYESSVASCVPSTPRAPTPTTDLSPSLCPPP